MNRITIFILLALPLFAGVIDYPGPVDVWTGDTLKKNTTLTAANLFYCSQLRNMHIWIKTTNPVDSTKYRLYYKVKFNMNDVLATPSDSVGSESGNTLIRVSDTLWHYRSIKVAPQYIQLYLQSDASAHGNRARVWLKVYISDQ
jgi:hypothetical protein